MTRRPLNTCEDCKYTWYPRGKDLSPKCPQCGNTHTKIRPTSVLAIILRIGQSGRKVEAPLTQAIHLGRFDAVSSIYPEIDLSEDGGREKGVSRRHARILKRGGSVLVEDLGSVNGTFVNGQQLASFRPAALRHGDQLELGKLLIEVELL